jgi:hypothetical protein
MPRERLQYELQHRQRPHRVTLRVLVRLFAGQIQVEAAGQGHQRGGHGQAVRAGPQRRGEGQVAARRVAHDRDVPSFGPPLEQPPVGGETVLDLLLEGHGRAIR